MSKNGTNLILHKNEEPLISEINTRIYLTIRLLNAEEPVNVYRGKCATIDIRLI